jgi:hypothetical protein
MAPINAPTPDQNVEPGPDPVDILALVAAIVPLPTPTAAALRLVCRATKLAVDHATTELSIPWDDVLQIPIQSTPLMSGLTSVTFTDDLGYDGIYLINACSIVCYSSETLETLHMHPGSSIVDRGGDEALAILDGEEALAILGGRQWPSLRALTLFSIQKTFPIHINLNSMPGLTKLMLSGELHPNDVIAMKAANHLSSMIEELELPAIDIIESYIGFESALTDFFSALPRLRRLTLDAFCNHLEFLNAADLPALEYFKLHKLDDLSLDPISSVPRLRLHTLIIKGVAVDPAGLIASGPETFPALLRLTLNIVQCDWSCILDSSMTTLTSLIFSVWLWPAAAPADLAAGLSRLPLLENLELYPLDIVSNIVEYPHELFQSELTSNLILPNIRRLVFGYGCRPGGIALGGLIQSAANTPLLDEIEMLGGCLNVEDYADLADAGRAGRWPNLRFIGESHFVGDPNHPELDETHCKNLLHEVWPQLELLIGDEFNPDDDLSD